MQRPIDRPYRDLELDLLRCPDCGGSIGKGLTCLTCQRGFAFDEGVYNLLPERLADVKRHEDSVFADGSEEVARTLARPWRRIMGRTEVQRFDREIVDTFPGGRFLELGGESCFASAIFKSVFPDSTVYASDVSPNALRNAGLPTARMFPSEPDFFVALDAENIPFQDSTFNSIFALTMMHHLPNPVRMLVEVQRVLAPGGRFVAVDAAVPAHFRWLFQGTANNRSRRYGIKEDLISFSQWSLMVRTSGMEPESLRIYTDPSYQYDPVFALAGRVIHRLPPSAAMRLFPVGIMIVYDRPL